jgi:hypothetical protein
MEAQREPVAKAQEWLRTTTTKFLRIGAGLREFLRWTEKIVYSPEPCHEPDPEFVAELTALLRKVDEEQLAQYEARRDAVKVD